MAFTKKDIQVLKGLFDEQKTGIISEITGVMDMRFKEVYAVINGLKIYMETRFKEIDNRFKKMDRRFEQIDKRFDKMDHRLNKIEITQERTIEILKDSVEILANHDKRIDRLERHHSVS